MPLQPEQMGAVPQQNVMQRPQPQGSGQLPPGVTPQDVEAFKRDPEVIELAKQVTGRNITPEQMSQVPTPLILEMKGMINKLGLQGAIQEAKRVLPQDIQAKLKQGPSQPVVQSPSPGPMPPEPMGR